MTSRKTAAKDTNIHVRQEIFSVTKHALLLVNTVFGGICKFAKNSYPLRFYLFRYLFYLQILAFVFVVCQDKQAVSGSQAGGIINELGSAFLGFFLSDVTLKINLEKVCWKIIHERALDSR